MASVPSSTSSPILELQTHLHTLTQRLGELKVKLETKPSLPPAMEFLKKKASDAIEKYSQPHHQSKDPAKASIKLQGLIEEVDANIRHLATVIHVLTPKDLRSGMRGVPMGYETISHVDPITGLYYHRRHISQFTECLAEEVIYFLAFGKDPNEEELTQFKQELQAAAVSLEPFELPEVQNPMKLLMVAITLLGDKTATKDYKKDAFNLIARLPYLIAKVMNTHARWGETPRYDPELDYVGNFVQMVQVPNKDEAKLREFIRLFLILHFAHGSGNLSTFSGLINATGGADLFNCIVNSESSLSGHRHGGANEDSYAFTLEACKHGIDVTIDKYLTMKTPIPGFGHSVLRCEDPRATVLYAFAQDHYPHLETVQTTLELRKKASQALNDRTNISNPNPNVDAISGTLAAAAGIPQQYFTVLFGFSRATGIAIQIWLQSITKPPLWRPEFLSEKAQNGIS